MVESWERLLFIPVAIPNAHLHGSCEDGKPKANDWTAKSLTGCISIIGEIAGWLSLSNAIGEP